MKLFSRNKLRTAITTILIFIFAVAFQAQASDGSNSLATKIASLKLGIDGYTIGTRLTADKKEHAKTHLQADAYDGTYKFNDGELFVVVAQEDDTILALYQRTEAADFDQAKKMVSGLMGLYGNPTTMAHDKLIYWAYGEQGKIAEENYDNSRQENKPLDILATVKFSSDFEITSTEQQEGAIYFIISSNRLTTEFMNRK